MLAVFGSSRSGIGRLSLHNGDQANVSNDFLGGSP
jgi:hypothetical protein